MKTKQERIMALTVTEKEHWKERISLRIDKRIDAIHAEEPNLQGAVNRQATQRALESLGLADMQAELDDIERQREALAKREKEIGKQVLAHVRGVSVDDVEDYFYGGNRHSDVKVAISRREALYRGELLAESDRGREILRLEQERENLLDTVWLATSSTQVKELWAKVTELLGATPTQLETDALAIAAADSD
jgi:hypothetical protein